MGAEFYSAFETMAVRQGKRDREVGDLSGSRESGFVVVCFT